MRYISASQLYLVRPPYGKREYFEPPLAIMYVKKLHMYTCSTESYTPSPALHRTPLFEKCCDIFEKRCDMHERRCDMHEKRCDMFEKCCDMFEKRGNMLEKCGGMFEK